MAGFVGGCVWATGDSMAADFFFLNIAKILAKKDCFGGSSGGSSTFGSVLTEGDEAGIDSALVRFQATSGRGWLSVFGELSGQAVTSLMDGNRGGSGRSFGGRFGGAMEEGGSDSSNGSVSSASPVP